MYIFSVFSFAAALAVVFGQLYAPALLKNPYQLGNSSDKTYRQSESYSHYLNRNDSVSGAVFRHNRKKLNQGDFSLAAHDNTEHEQRSYGGIPHWDWLPLDSLEGHHAVEADRNCCRDSALNPEPSAEPASLGLLGISFILISLIRRPTKYLR